MTITGAKEDIIPLNQIKRPIPPVLDHDKIDAMVSTLQGTPKASSTCILENITPGELPLVDVFLLRSNSQNHYFAFGGCHRLQAYDRLLKLTDEEPMVRCRVYPATQKTLRLYLGSSVDTILNH